MESESAARPGPSAAEKASVRVYIVDDHELMREGLRTVLEAAPGVEVVGESGTAAEAIRRIPALRPQVALLDVRLPDGSGVEVCRAVRASDPSIRALMLTSFDDAEARSAAMLAGASGFVLKQIRSRRLLEAVRAAAAGEVVVDHDGAGAPAGDTDRMERLAVESLTPQERRVLDLVVEGLTNVEIGDRLGIREKTVRNHVTNVLAKLGFSRRTQAAVYMARHQG